VIIAVELTDDQLDEIVSRVLERLPKQEPDEWLNTEEAAAYTGLAKGTLDNDACKGGSHKIPCSRPNGKNGRRLYRRSDLDAYLNGAAVHTHPAPGNRKEPSDAGTS